MKIKELIRDNKVKIKSVRSKIRIKNKYKRAIR